MAKYSIGEDLKISEDRLQNILLLLTIVTFIICSSFFLNNDFWQDEIYTIDHFVFKSWKTVLTDYHSTNNHILFNIFLKLVITIAGITDIKVILEYPIILRLVPFVFSILSIFILYRGVNNCYGSTVAKITVSIFCTTIVFVEFSGQLRGYSLSILITTLQFFTFLKILQIGRRKDAYYLFFLTLCSLICLPTNIYLTICFLLISIILWLSANARKLIFYNGNKHRISSCLIQPLIAAIFISTIYYVWLLGLQSENELITYYSLFNLKNLLQASAVFYHFMDYRFYFLLYFIIWAAIIIYKRENLWKSKFFLPAALYILPFVVFYFHGGIIIQRVFLSQLAFFALVTAIVCFEVNLLFSKKVFNSFIIVLNLLLLGFSFLNFLSDSIKNNHNSVHKHALREHYYLVDFNAKEASLLAYLLSKSMNKRLVVWDDFGETGIKYYLKHYQIPYENFSEGHFMQEEIIYLVNNKKEFEKKSKETARHFRKILSSEKQYNLYLSSN